MSGLFGAWFAVVALGASAGLAQRMDRGVAAQLAAVGRDLTGGRERQSGWTRLVARVAASPLVADERLRRRVVLADVRGGLEAHAARKLAWAVCAGLGGWIVGGLGASGLVLGLLTAVAGFRLPDMALARRATHRQEAIRSDAPDLFDLLCAAVGAGLGPSAALELAASELDGPLAVELGRAVGSVRMGTRWADAMGELAGRTEVESIGRLRTALAQTDRLGASLESVLRDLAREARAERRGRTEARARAAPVKLLFPLVLLILPAFLLLTVVPVVLATLRSL